MDIEQIRATYQLTPTEVAAELLALSVLEYANAPETTIVVELEGKTGQIVDTGRGMQLMPNAC